VAVTAATPKAPTKLLKRRHRWICFMPDWMDRAQEDQDARLEQVLGAHQSRPRLSQISLSCVSCGDEIPEMRRIAVSNCCLCVECQADMERVHR